MAHKTHSCTVKRYLSAALASAMALVTPAHTADKTWTLAELLALIDRANPAVEGAEAQRQAATAALRTARAYPNPTLEARAGASSERGPGARSGTNSAVVVAQALDLPFVRRARQQVAEAGISAAEQAAEVVRKVVRSQAQQAFYEILRRQEALTVATDDRELLGTIRDRVRLRVEVGEAPRYELVKAEAEVLSADKVRDSAALLLDDAKSALQALYGSALPGRPEISGELPAPPHELPPLDTMRAALLRHPVLATARAEVEMALAKVRLEEKLRYPQPVIRVGVEEDPGLQQWNVGISVPLPLWNQRQGPIAEAAARLRSANAGATQQQFALTRELELAYNRYRIARGQVEAFERGLLAQAEAALKVAELAYRVGERGIIDYLDAQRAYRTIRTDYLNARFDRQAAWIDLERLRVPEEE